MLEVDINEPYEEALKLMAPSVPCQVLPLNAQDWADYRWQTECGDWVNVERKTWPEILADVDKVEDQLRRHMQHQKAARLLFVLEGMYVARPDGTHLLRSTNRDSIYVLGYRYTTRLSRIYSWLYSASQYVEVFQTPSYEATCQMLVSFYQADQKPETEHKTFHRHIKKLDFNPNPQVLALMGVAPGLGEVRASALIDRFTTVYGVLSAKPADLMDVPGIGKGLAVSVLQRAGRVDV